MPSWLNDKQLAKWATYILGSFGNLAVDALGNEAGLNFEGWLVEDFEQPVQAQDDFSVGSEKFADLFK